MKLQIINNEKIFKISSEYCVKSVFSYLDYNYLLKLVKDNKELQNKLGINLQNYKTEANYCYLKRKVKRINRIGANDVSLTSIRFLIT